MLSVSRLKVLVGTLLTARPVGRIVKGLGVRLRGHSLALNLADDAVPDAMAASIALRLHERSERKLISRWLDRSAGTIELGSGFGTVTVAIDKRTAGKRIVTVEANRHLADFLARQFHAAPSCTVIYGAIGGAEEFEVLFMPDAGILGSRLASEPLAGAVSVPAISLDRVLAILGSPTFNLVCDIEGAEFDLFARSSRMLVGCRSIVVELHPGDGPSASALFADLEQLGLRFRERRNDVFAFTRD